MAAISRSAPPFFNSNRVSLPITFRPSLRFANNIFSNSLVSSPSLSSTQIRSTGKRSNLVRFPSLLAERASLVRCFHCGFRGHLAKSCKLRITCFHCGGSGHKRARCYKKRSQTSHFRPNPASFVDDSCSLLGSAITPPVDLFDKVALDPDVINCGSGLIQPASSVSKDGYEETSMRFSSKVSAFSVTGKGFSLFTADVKCGSFSFGRLLEWGRGVETLQRSSRSLKHIRWRSLKLFQGLKAFPPRNTGLASFIRGFHLAVPHGSSSSQSSKALPEMDCSKLVSQDDVFPAAVGDSCSFDCCVEDLESSYFVKAAVLKPKSMRAFNLKPPAVVRRSPRFSKAAV